MSELGKALIDSFKWHMEMSRKNWLTTDQFKKAMRNKKLRKQIGFETANCLVCRKTLATMMSMAIPHKFHRYRGHGIKVNEKTMLHACNKCYDTHFEYVEAKWENHTYVKGYYRGRTSLGESILAEQAKVNGNRDK